MLKIQRSHLTFTSILAGYVNKDVEKHGTAYIQAKPREQFIATLLVISGGSLRTAVGLSLNLQRDYVRERAIEGET